MAATGHTQGKTERAFFLLDSFFGFVKTGWRSSYVVVEIFMVITALASEDDGIIFGYGLVIWIRTIGDICFGGRITVYANGKDEKNK